MISPNRYRIRANDLGTELLVSTYDGLAFVRVFQKATDLMREFEDREWNWERALARRLSKTDFAYMVANTHCRICDGPVDDSAFDGSPVIRCAECRSTDWGD